MMNPDSARRKTLVSTKCDSEKRNAKTAPIASLLSTSPGNICRNTNADANPPLNEVKPECAIKERFRSLGAARCTNMSSAANTAETIRIS